MASSNDILSTTTAFADIPLHLLRAELTRRQNDDNNDPSSRPECGSNTVIRNYNTSLHVFALFLILALSTFACSFPVIARRFPKLPVPSHTLFLSRHFGTGVLIATGFVHLLPTAYVSLTDPCLPPFWNKTYPPMAGFIAMVSVLVVVAIEMFFAVKGAVHSHEIDFDQLREGGGSTAMDPLQRRMSVEHRRSGSFRAFRQEPIGLQQHEGVQQNDAEVVSPRSPYSDSPGSVDKPLPPPPPQEDDDGMGNGHLAEEEDGDNDSDLDLDELDPETSDLQPLTGGKHDTDTRPTKKSSLNTNGHIRPKQPSRNVSFAHPISSSISPPPPSSSPSPLPAHAQEQRLVLQCLLLEAGILFHSIFIGMALSVSTGPAFIVLLIAISFHQTFEGLALGSRIAAIPSFSTDSFKPWLMSLMYGITTPIGQAIGLAVHTLYDPASQFGLLMVGIVNAISAGLLLYAGLVQLLAEDFLSDRSYVELQGKRRIQASLAVLCGTMLMSLVGAFA